MSFTPWSGVTKSLSFVTIPVGTHKQIMKDVFGGTDLSLNYRTAPTRFDTAQIDQRHAATRSYSQFVVDRNESVDTLHNLLYSDRKRLRYICDTFQ